MAIREIVYPKPPPAPIVAKEVIKLSESELSIIRDLKDTMDHKMLSSISAPKIGSLKRIIVVSTGHSAEGESIDEVVMVNPCIVDGFGDMLCEEPDRLTNEMKTVPRAYMVIISYQDELGEQREKFFSGFDSAIVQREIEGLDVC
jgi:peptide deformylase